MARVLVVTQAFGDYAKGARIEDPKLVESFLATHRHHVVPVLVPDPPAQLAKGAEPEADDKADAAPAKR